MSAESHIRIRRRGTTAITGLPRSPDDIDPALHAEQRLRIVITWPVAELMQMTIRPAERGLDYLAQLVEKQIRGQIQPAPQWRLCVGTDLLDSVDAAGIRVPPLPGADAAERQLVTARRPNCHEERTD